MPQRRHAGERRKIVRARPAETTGGIAGVATAIAALAGASTAAVAIIGTLAGLLPVIVTYLVNHGGVAGAISALWRGKPENETGLTAIEALVVVFLALVILIVVFRLI